MCVQCVMGAAAGFGIFQTYRYVIKDHARKLLARQQALQATDSAPAARASIEAELADGTASILPSTSPTSA